MLAVLKPDHVYFRKDFVPKREIDRVMIDNQDDFLTGLPPGKWRKRKGGIFKEPEENRLKRNLAVYERRLARGKERLIELANEKDSDSEVSEGDSSDEDNQIRPKQHIYEEKKVGDNAKGAQTGNTFDFGEVSTVVS